ncbi:MAG TPA: hypothetical protein VFQ47_02780 [Nitrososphaera sp.]|nr:hypothetical protein [Nitrososphaera sp.]
MSLANFIIIFSIIIILLALYVLWDYFSISKNIRRLHSEKLRSRQKAAKLLSWRRITDQVTREKIKDRVFQLIGNHRESPKPYARLLLAVGNREDITKGLAILENWIAHLVEPYSEVHTEEVIRDWGGNTFYGETVETITWHGDDIYPEVKSAIEILRNRLTAKYDIAPGPPNNSFNRTRN